MDRIRNEAPFTPDKAAGDEQKMFDTMRGLDTSSFVRGAFAVLALATAAALPAAPADAQTSSGARPTIEAAATKWTKSIERSQTPLETVISYDSAGHKVTISYFAESIKSELKRMGVTFDEKTGILTCSKMKQAIGANGTMPIYGTGGTFELMAFDGPMHTDEIAFTTVERTHPVGSRLQQDTITNIFVEVDSTDGTNSKRERLDITEGMCSVR